MDRYDRLKQILKYRIRTQLSLIVLLATVAIGTGLFGFWIYLRGYAFSRAVLGYDCHSGVLWGSCNRLVPHYNFGAITPK